MVLKASQRPSPKIEASQGDLWGSLRAVWYWCSFAEYRPLAILGTYSGVCRSITAAFAPTVMFRAVLTLIWGTWVNISHSELERPVELIRSISQCPSHRCRISSDQSGLPVIAMRSWC